MSREPPARQPTRGGMTINALPLLTLLADLATRGLTIEGYPAQLYCKSKRVILAEVLLIHFFAVLNYVI